MADFPGIGFSFTQPIDMRISEMLTGVRGDLAIKVYGPDLATLNHLAGEIVTILKNVRGAEDTFTLKNDGVQYLKLSIDRLAAGRFGSTSTTSRTTSGPARAVMSVSSRPGAARPGRPARPAAC